MSIKSQEVHAYDYVIGQLDVQVGSSMEVLTCTGGGAFGWIPDKQQGCHIGVCKCFAPFFECNSSIGVCTQSIEDGSIEKCGGKCHLSAWGEALAVVTFILIVLAPIITFWYHHYRRKRRRRKGDPLVNLYTVNQIEQIHQQQQLEQHGDEDVENFAGLNDQAVTIRAPLTLEDQIETVEGEETSSFSTLPRMPGLHSVSSLMNIISIVGRTQVVEAAPAFSKTPEHPHRNNSSSNESDPFKHLFNVRALFDEKPNKVFGQLAKPRIHLETMSKFWLQVIFYCLVVSFILSFIIEIVPNTMSKESIHLGSKNCLVRHNSNTSNHSLTEEFIANISSTSEECQVVKDMKPNATEAFITAAFSKSLHMGAKYLSISLDMKDHEARFDAGNFPSISFQYSITVIREGQPLYAEYTERVTALCKCIEFEEEENTCRRMDCGNVSLLYASIYQSPFNGFFDSYKEEMYVIKIKLFTLDATVDGIASDHNLPHVVVTDHYSFVQLINGIVKMVLLFFDAGALVWWIYRNRVIWFMEYMGLESVSKAKEVASKLFISYEPRNFMYSPAAFASSVPAVSRLSHVSSRSNHVMNEEQGSTDTPVTAPGFNTNATMTSTRSGFRGLLPERILIIFLLIVNLCNPIMLIRSLESKWSLNQKEETTVQLWTLCWHWAWLLVLLWILDLQRTRRISFKFILRTSVATAFCLTLDVLSWHLFASVIVRLIHVVLIALVACIFFSVGVSASKTLRQSHFFSSRTSQLSFRMLMLICYSVVIIFMLNGLQMNRNPPKSQYLPESFIHDELAFTIITHVATIILMIMFLPPPTSSTQIQGNTAFVLRGMKTLGVLSSPNKSVRSAMQRWQNIKRIVREEVENYWVAPKAFCVETACAMYNLAYQVYFAVPGKAVADSSDQEVEGKSGSIPSAASSSSSSESIATSDAEVYNEYVMQNDGLELVTKLYDKETDTHGLIMRGKHRIVVAFRGTSSKANAKTDLRVQFCQPEEFQADQVIVDDDDQEEESDDCTLGRTNREPEAEQDVEARAPMLQRLISQQQKNTTKILTTVIGGSTVQLHSGFYEAYLTIQDELLANIRNLVDLMGGLEQVQIYTTGHSLGGALATIAALDLSIQLSSKRIVMYNFGSPRVGNHAFAFLFNERVPQAYRIVSDGDVVVGTPKHAKFCNFASDHRYKHVGTQVLLANRAFGVFVVNPNIVEQALIARLRGSPQNHLLSSYKLKLSLGVACALEEADERVRSCMQESIGKFLEEKSKRAQSFVSLSGLDDLMESDSSSRDSRSSKASSDVGYERGSHTRGSNNSYIYHQHGDSLV